MENIYDKQIKDLTENPWKIMSAWYMGKGLFKYVGRLKYESDDLEYTSGCLTMIRKNPSYYKALINGEVDEHLTQEIANDNRLPLDPERIKTEEHLLAFKEWQERIDKLQNQEL